MSYSEQNGQVVLTMSQDDYDRLLYILAAFTVYTPQRNQINKVLALLNRLNQGNPHYTPYEIKES